LGGKKIGKTRRKIYKPGKSKLPRPTGALPIRKGKDVPGKRKEVKDIGKSKQGHQKRGGGDKKRKLENRHTDEPPEEQPGGAFELMEKDRAG